jgi:hypothetical protein
MKHMITKIIQGQISHNASFITDAGEPGITAFPLGTSYKTSRVK